MVRVGIAISLLLGLSACQTLYGSGPLTLTPRVAEYVKNTMGQRSISYIAVSEDGTVAGSSYCPTGISSECTGNNAAVVAISACERTGKKCYIYATSDKIIWDFSAPPPKS